MRKSKYGLFAAIMAFSLIAGACSNAEDGKQSGTSNIITEANGTEKETNSATGKNENDTSNESSTSEGVTEEDTTQKDTTEKDTTEETTTPIEGTTPNGEYKPITMAFVGDTYFSDKLYDHYTKSGITGFMGQSIVDIFQNTDIMIANHEYVATDLPDDAKDTVQIYNFKSPVAREVLWRELGVDIVSMANNHAMDYGEQSLLDTFEALEANDIAYIGAGKNLADALEAEIKVLNGKKIAILGSCRFIPSWSWYAQENKPGVMTTYESTDRYKMILEEIKRLKEVEKCDIVAVYVHFGKEKSFELTSNQPVIAHGYIDAGADFVIGSHAHNLQGIEIYKGAPIYYNLGNFLFSNYSSDTMVVNIEINEDNSVTTSITPCVSKQYTVNEDTDKKAQEIFDFIESISINVEIDENGNVTEKIE